MTAKLTFLNPATTWLTTACIALALTGQPAPAGAQQISPAPNTIRLSPDDQERSQYGHQSNFFFLPPGQTGENNYKSAGFFGQKLRPYISGSPAAVVELNKYSRQKTR